MFLFGVVETYVDGLGPLRWNGIVYLIQYSLIVDE